MNKKILLVNSSLTAGGSERVMSIIANQLAEEKYDVTMVLVRETTKDTYQLHPKVKCIRFKYNSKNKLIRLIKRIIKLRTLLKNNKFDRVISFMHEINTQTLISNIGLKNKIIVSERANPNSHNRKFFQRLFEDFMYRKAYKIVFQTEQVQKMFNKYIQNKSVVIPNPINPQMPEPYRGKRKNVIVAVGRLTEQKNFKMLINVFAKFQKEFSEYKLEIYGEGYLKNNLEEQIKNLKLQDKVSLPGYVENVTDKIKSAKMYISTSNFEGISNAMIEALAMGIPTICTDCPVGGAALMIENNINGILIPVNNEEKLYKAMLKIATDEKFTNSISKESIKIKDKYSSKEILKLWKEIIDK